jgi:phage terminase large subunit GpA-like protein
MDAYNQPEIEWIIVKKSARIGWTSILGHVIGYHIDQNPCSQLIVQPTLDDASSWSKEDLQPIIEETPVLCGKVSEAKTRDSKSTITKKHYAGGVLHIVGANSARGFRRISTRIVNLDEVDGYPLTAGQEGDQVQLAAMRADDYWDRKIGIGSTPTVEHVSRISNEFNSSSRGYFILTCPDCGGEHVRLFREPEKPLKIRGKKFPVSFLRWDKGKPETAKWVCPESGCLIGYDKHRPMIAGGYWLGDDWEWRGKTGFKFLDSFKGKIGFAIWSGYGFSPNSTPAKLAAKFIEVKKDPEELKTFVNLALGEEWREKGETVDDESLKKRCETYAAEVPKGAVILSLAGDVQGDRIEFEVVGWDKDEQSWSIDYQVIPGDTTDSRVWDEFKECLKVTYDHELGGKMSISAIAVDAGYLTSTVQAFVESLNYDYAWAVMGTDGEKRPVTESRLARAMRMRKRQKKNTAEAIGVDEAKSILMRRLKIDKPGPGYCHFPKGRDDEYFAQLTAEKVVVRYKKGRPVREWVKMRPRNEALDIRNYNLAALRLSNPDWAKWEAHTHQKQQQPAAQAPRRRVLSRGI